MHTGTDASVRVVDVRAEGAERRLLDRPSRAELADLAVAGRLVVVDGTAELVRHHEWYVRLAGAVRHVVCVAVGPISRSEGGGYALRQSAAVRDPWVTLWVGDEEGIGWAGGSDDGSAPERGSGTFPDLLAALAAAPVFDEVVRHVRGVRYQGACPALEAVRPTVGLDELRELHRRALLEIVAAPGEAVAPPRSEHEDNVAPVTVPAHTPLARARDHAGEQLAHARRLVLGLRGPGGLLRAGDGRTSWQAVAGVGRALAEHREQAGVALAGLQRRIDGEQVAAVAGVADPQEADHEAIAEELDDMVRDGLRSGRTLPELAAMLRAVGRSDPVSPMGAARRAVGGIGTEIVERLTNPPEAVVPPAVLAGSATTAFASTLVASGLPALGVGVGGVLGLVWLGLIAMVVRRRPAGEAGSTPVAPVLAVLIAIAAGMIVGGVLGGAVGAALPPAVQVAVGGALVVVALAVAVQAWNAVVNRWSARLDLAEAEGADRELRAAVDDALSGPYRTAPGRARRHMAADLLAVAVGDVSTVFTTWAGDVRGGGARGESAAAAQVTAVLRADLGALAREAVRGCLHDVATGAPLQVSRTAVTNRTADLRLRYQAYLDLGDIQNEPPVELDPEPRARLAEVLWRRSPEGRRVLLDDDPRILMTQFCRRTDLRALDRDWSGARHLRFGPVEAQRVILGAVAEDVVATKVGMAGLIRLVPLKGGVVRHVQPAADCGDDPVASGPAAEREVSSA